MSWQPIETAPKDGTWILGYESSARYTDEKWAVYVMHWDRTWDGQVYELYGLDPTHWMPLPEPPK